MSNKQLQQGLRLQQNLRAQIRESILHAPAKERTPTALAWLSAMIGESVFMAHCADQAMLGSAYSNNVAVQKEAVVAIQDVLRKLFPSLPEAQTTVTVVRPNQPV